MPKILLFILLLGVCYGCGQRPPAAIQIGTIAITKDEFERAFLNSPLDHGSLQARRQFLELMINKKLVLKEAERRGMDKDPKLLQDLQMFWETNLMKLALSAENQRIARQITVTPAEIEAYYSQHAQSQFMGKPLQAVQGEIKVVLLKSKQSRMFKDWVEALRQKSAIVIDYPALGIPEQ